MALKESHASLGDSDDRFSTLESRILEDLSVQQIKVKEKINDISMRIVIVLLLDQC